MDPTTTPQSSDESMKIYDLHGRWGTAKGIYDTKFVLIVLRHSTFLLSGEAVIDQRGSEPTVSREKAKGGELS